MPRATWTTSKPSATEISARAESPVSSGSALILEGLHLTAGAAGLGAGGAVLVSTGAELTADRCSISNCSGYSGGGVFILGGKARLTNCTFTGNSSNHAGADGGAALGQQAFDRLRVERADTPGHQPQEPALDAGDRGEDEAQGEDGDHADHQCDEQQGQRRIAG